MLTVGVADMKISKQKGDIIVTHALGSCLGIVLHDNIAGIGGMLHAMLPDSESHHDKDNRKPEMFIDLGFSLLFKHVCASGAEKKRLKIYVAGGAGEDDFFNIGKRNFIFLHKLLWKNGMRITSKEVGGNDVRNMYCEIGTGKVWIQSKGEKKHLSALG